MSTQQEKQRFNLLTWMKANVAGFMIIIIAVGAFLVLTQQYHITQNNEEAEVVSNNEIVLSPDELKALLEKAQKQGKDELLQQQASARNKVVPFKPALEHTEQQNIVALAIGIFGESRGDPYMAKLNVAWAIVNRAIDDRDDWMYQPTIAGVLASGKGGQYSSMGPYLVDLENIAWGRKLDFVPALAKKNAGEMDAWLESLKIATDVIEGKLPRLHTATHFISLKGMRGKPIPSWVTDLMPMVVDGAGLHLFMRDYYIDEEGKRITFSKNNPYSPSKHDKFQDLN